MGWLNKSGCAGILNEIRCDESSYLIWKWHPSNVGPGDTTRENAIRFGSSLRVKDGEVAVFVYKQNNGIRQDFIEGPFDQILETKNLPVISNLLGLAYGGGTPFQAEIYFINLSKIVQVKFGVPFFDVYDPRFVDFGVPVAVRGTITFHIADYKEFIKLHRLSTFDLNDFQRQIRDAVNRYVKDTVASAPSAHNIPVVQIESKISQLNDEVEYNIGERLKENFGVEITGVDIGAIEIDKSSDSYQQLMSVTKDIAFTKTKAETQDYVERLRIQREEGQYAQHKQTQSANLGAFQTEKQVEVGVAGAQAFGQAGTNGNGNVNLGGGGFNMGAVMASMVVGGAVGQNLAGAMSNLMPGTHQQGAPTTPPPIPETAYYIAANGQPIGPFAIPTLQQMATSGQLTADSLVWKAGMQQWVNAGTVAELQALFGNIPPIPPVPHA